MVVGGRQLVCLRAWLNHQQRYTGAFPHAVEAHACTDRRAFVFKHEYSGLVDDGFFVPHEQKNLLVLGTSAVQPEQRGELL